jgi:hypothetical protein
MNRKDIEKRYKRAEKVVWDVYNRIYSDTGSDLIDDLVHDNMMYQMQGMHEEILDILEGFEDGDDISDADFKYIDEAVVYAKSVGRALTACSNITDAPFC